MLGKKVTDAIASVATTTIVNSFEKAVKLVEQDVKAAKLSYQFIIIDGDSMPCACSSYFTERIGSLTIVMFDDPEAHEENEEEMKDVYSIVAKKTMESDLLYALEQSSEDI